MNKPGRMMLLTLLSLVLAACRTPAPPTNPTLGDTWTRPADDMVLVYVPAGEFAMGSTDEQVDAALVLCRARRGECERSLFEDEQPVHPVALDAFWIDRTELSNAQYRRCVEAEVCDIPQCWDDGDLNADEQPVVCVTWQQAQTYCEWAGGHLPTEAEWEYAARGVEGRPYPWGETFDGSRLNYCDANCSFDWADAGVDDGYASTAPVGSFFPGASWCGALDLSGNVWEWVSDWYGPYTAEHQVNPAGTDAGRRRVLRGGSWDMDPVYLRSATRNWGSPDGFSRVSGFRCAWPSTP